MGWPHSHFCTACYGADANGSRLFDAGIYGRGNSGKHCERVSDHADSVPQPVYRIIFAANRWFPDADADRRRDNLDLHRRRIFVLGVGLGALFGGDNLIVQESVDAKDSGIALSTVQLFQSLGATIGLSIFGSLLSKHIKDGIAALDSRLPADAAANIETGNIPADLPTALLHDIKQVFSYSFQNMFVISLVFAIAAFILCWFLKKEVLSKKAEEGMETESGASAGG